MWCATCWLFKANLSASQIYINQSAAYGILGHIPYGVNAFIQFLLLPCELSSLHEQLPSIYIYYPINSLFAFL